MLRVIALLLACGSAHAADYALKVSTAGLPATCVSLQRSPDARSWTVLSGIPVPNAQVTVSDTGGYAGVYIRAVDAAGLECSKTFFVPVSSTACGGAVVYSSSGAVQRVSRSGGRRSSRR